MATGGEGAREVRERTLAVLKAGRKFFGALPAGAFDKDHPTAALTAWAAGLSAAIQERFGAPFPARPARFSLVNREAKRPGATRVWKPLIPDDIVFWASSLRQAELKVSPREWVEKKVKDMPRALVVAVEGLGLVVGGTELQMQSAEENLLSNLLIHRLIARQGRPRSLTSRHADVLTSMGSEKYRQTLTYKPR
jgi:hypothetical protein